MPAELSDPCQPSACRRKYIVDTKGSVKQNSVLFLAMRSNSNSSAVESESGLVTNIDPKADATRRPWDGKISEEEQALYLRGGFEKTAQIRGRAALLLVDVQYRMTGTRPLPLPEAIAEFPTSCGEAAWRAMPNIGALLEKFRSKNLPVIYVALGRTTSFKRTSQAPVKADESGLAPRPEMRMSREMSEYDIVAWKYAPSAFFGTPVSSLLIDRQVETVVIAGSSTSGCVRATAVDAFSNRFNVVIPEDAVFDRGPTSHAVALFDMATRYAGVAPADQVAALLDAHGRD